MNNIVVAIIAGAVVIAGAVGVATYNRKKNWKKQLAASTEQIEGELKLEDIVSYFRSHNLNKEIHTPFVANGDAERVQAMIKDVIQPKPGYTLTIIGVLNNKNNQISPQKCIFSKGLSNDLKQLLANDDLVVLQ